MSFTLNRRNIGAILTGREGNVRQDLRRRAERIRNAAGPGHEVDEGVGATRAHAHVRTTKRVVPSGMDALRRAIGAGRG
jgi:hypothetical protein